MAFGRLQRRISAQPMSDINVTPLVDVMLVLVVIFILAAPLLAHSIRLELPRAATAQPRPTSAMPAVMVQLEHTGQVWLDGHALSPEALAARLVEIAAQQPQTEIQLRADARVPYGRVVQIIDAAHAAGLQRIGFVAQPHSAP